jgi:hypothetical protein
MLLPALGMNSNQSMKITNSACILISCLAYISILKTEAIYSAEASLAFHRATWPYVAEDATLHDLTQSCYELVSLSDL